MKWQAPEFDYRKKDVSWYWLSIIVAVIILGFAVWQRNFPFGFFIVVAEIMILVWANTEPPMIDFELNDKGLAVGEHAFHSYAELANFSVDEEGNEEWSHLFFQFHRPKPKLKIKIPKHLVNDARQIFKKSLPEIKHESSFVDAIEEIIGF
ncbi:MAG: hypothetical protein HY434_00370 [Candidatus Liptonbacteria bacterium]|nr:hypothetical protein [Candidatus Liptonbacteria bacterium]